jgi:hypothetical protein
MVERCVPKTSILRMRFACWITKVTYIHTHNHAIHIALPMQHWLRECDSMILYTDTTWYLAGRT